MARRLHVLGIVVTGLLLYACCSGVARETRDSNAGPAAGRVSAAGTTANTGSVATARPTAREAPSTSADAPACRAQQLSMRLGRNGPATGTVGAYLIFRNIARTACRVSGWPHVIGIGSSTSPTRAVRGGQLIGMPPIRRVPTVRLAGSETATVLPTARTSGRWPRSSPTLEPTCPTARGCSCQCSYRRLRWPLPRP